MTDLVPDATTPLAPAARIEHLALWTSDLERMRAFYEGYFGAVAGERYHSTNRPGFVSYFVSFPGGGSRLELMLLPELHAAAPHPAAGYAHLAVTLGSRQAVESLVARMRSDGVRIVSETRLTGDGYFEAVVEDPDGNAVEISA